MKRIVAILATFIATIVAAADTPIAVEHAWARATPPGASVGAVYATVRSAQPDAIVAISTPRAQRVEMHATTQENGMMKMRPVMNVELSASKPAHFKPGGLHIMLLGLQTPLTAHESFPLTFKFRKAAPVIVNVRVGGADATDAQEHRH